MNTATSNPPHPPTHPPPQNRLCQLGLPQGADRFGAYPYPTQRRGYTTSKTFADADLVIVNTCGFIDEAVQESLEAIGDALAENGKVIVTGCLGAKPAVGSSEAGSLVRNIHPKVLAVTGPHAT